MNTSDPRLICCYYLRTSIRTCCVACCHKTYYPLDAHCIVVWRFHHHPLLTHCVFVRRFHHLLLACCIVVQRYHRHPLLARCISVRRLPVGRLPVLLQTLVLYAAFVVLKHSLCCSYSSRSDWYTRMFYPFLIRECSGGLYLLLKDTGTSAGLMSKASQVAYYYALQLPITVL
jgi:hypothetical protein